MTSQYTKLGNKRFSNSGHTGWISVLRGFEPCDLDLVDSKSDASQVSLSGNNTYALVLTYQIWCELVQQLRKNGTVTLENSNAVKSTLKTATQTFHVLHQHTKFGNWNKWFRRYGMDIHSLRTQILTVTWTLKITSQAVCTMLWLITICRFPSLIGKGSG